MGFVMRCVILLTVFFLVVSCSDNDKLSREKQQIWIDGIDYGISSDKIHLLGILEINGCTSSLNNFEKCTINNCWVINNKHSFISLKNLDACYLRDYLWIIDEDTIHSGDSFYNVNYGEHFVKLILVDTFGDSLSESTYLRIDEPLKITLLSPVHEYEAAKKDIIEFQYHISGIDTWEEGMWKDTVYVSTDTTLLWEEGNALKNIFFKPPSIQRDYYWGVKISKQDTAFYSRIRKICIKD